MWFRIKAQSKFTKGPSHVLRLIQLVRKQPLEVQAVVKLAVQRNAYFAEPGIMLTSLMEDPDADVRKSGIKILQKVRANPSKAPKIKYLKGIRKHEIPQLNWSAANWTEIIDLEFSRSCVKRKLSLQWILLFASQSIPVTPKQLKEW